MVGVEGGCVSVEVGVSVGVSSDWVAVGNGVTWTIPSSTKACAVSSITVGRRSSGINVGGSMPGKLEQPALNPTNNIKIKK